MNPFENLLLNKHSNQQTSSGGQFDWATVKNLSPLTLELDSTPGVDTEDGIDNLVGELVLGQRVRVHIYSGRIYIYGNPRLMRETLTSSPVTISDWNTATQVGFVRSPPNAANTPPSTPSGNAIAGLVMSQGPTGGGGQVTQITNRANSPELWYRYRFDAGNWGAWARMSPHESAMFFETNDANGLWAEVGSNSSTAEPSWRMSRLHAVGQRSARIYIPNHTKAGVALNVTKDGSDVSTLHFYEGGELFTRSYGPEVDRPLPFAIDTGIQATGGTANTVLNHSISFASNRFTNASAISVFCQPYLVGPNITTEVTPSGVTTSGFTMNTYRTDSAGYNVRWFAIQLTP